MKLDAETRSLIAAEYALGTLRGAARRRFEALMRDDDELRAETQAWQRRFGVLYEDLPEEYPAPSSWPRILARTGLLEDSQSRPRPSLWQNLGLWRLASASLATALVAVLVLPRIEPPASSVDTPAEQTVSTPGDGFDRQSTLVLVLTDEVARASWVMTADRGDLSARPVRQLDAVDDRSYQLWLIPPGDLPKSVGLIDPESSSAFELPAELERLLAPGVTLAVSLEPLGGSPTGQPTGPVLFTGQVLEL